MEQNEEQRVYLSVRESGKGKWKMTGSLLRRGRLLLQLEQGSPKSDCEFMEKSSLSIKCRYSEGPA